MLWVKLWTDIHSDVDFLRLSRDARHTFLDCMISAGSCNANGALCGRTGAMTVTEISRYTGIAVTQQRAALDELVRTGFMTLTEATWAIANFHRDDLRKDHTASQRMRRYRAKQRNVTERNVTTVTLRPKKRREQEEKRRDDARARRKFY